MKLNKNKKRKEGLMQQNNEKYVKVKEWKLFYHLVIFNFECLILNYCSKFFAEYHIVVIVV